MLEDQTSQSGWPWMGRSREISEYLQPETRQAGDCFTTINNDKFPWEHMHNALRGCNVAVTIHITRVTFYMSIQIILLKKTQLNFSQLWLFYVSLFNAFLLTLNIVLASSGRDTLCIRIAKLKAFVRKMGLSTGSTGLSLMWNNVAVWSKPR